jgi:aromatic-L-amino-acid/L-tryptophan decarboxylase
MDPELFRRHGHDVVDWIADYLAGVGSLPVLPPISPGDVLASLPAEPPRRAESMDAILADFRRVIVPATTHWNHPGFHAYFSITGSGPGILGEALAAALNVNAMLWRSGPAQTELEHLTLDWLRQMLGLPPEFEGVINDTASTSTFYALAAAREALPGLAIRQEGLAGRPEVPRLRVYCSREAHSSVDKAVAALGLGLDGVAHVDTDAEQRVDAAALRAAVEADRDRGILPLAVVATVGTTSTTAVDPVPAIADVCADHGVWLHVDAAYGGTAAVVPSMRWVLEGCERADSLVVNPHKWLFVPLDCSVLYTRRPETLAAAFSLEPEYLRTPEAARARSLMDYGLALGRRFRSLKLWFVIRYFGVEGIITRIEEHMRLAQLFARWIDEHPTLERLAPTRFSVVVFRHRPAGIPDADVDAHNEELMEALNAAGEVFLSHTRVDGHFAIRLAIGNLRTTEAHVARAWTLLRRAIGDDVA